MNREDAKDTKKEKRRMRHFLRALGAFAVR